MDVIDKIKSLQCSWIKRLYDDKFHEWKLIPQYLIKKTFGLNFVFHSNLSFDDKLVSHFPTFFKVIFKFWMETFSYTSDSLSCIKSQFLWFNRQLKIGNKSFFFKEFSEKNLNFLNQLYEPEGNLKQWQDVKEEFQLNDVGFFKWVQIIHSIPVIWKNLISKNDYITNTEVHLDHHLIWNNRILCIEKLSAREIYSLITDNKKHKPTSQKYFESLFSALNLDWNLIYTLPRKIINSTKFRAFQYKLLNNVLYLNDKLFLFGKSETKLCSFCKTENETVIHLFSVCNCIKSLWNEIKDYFRNDFTLTSLTPQIAILGYLDKNDETFLVQNIILLLFKHYVYKSRSNANLNLLCFINTLSKIKNYEKSLSLKSPGKSKFYEKMWSIIENRLQSNLNV